MYHDDDQRSDKLCDGSKYIMATSTGAGRVTFSKCSAHHVRTKFQSVDDVNCLVDDDSIPTVPGYELEPLDGVQDWPGYTMGPDEQCQFAFGKAYSADHAQTVSKLNIN